MHKKINKKHNGIPVGFPVEKINLFSIIYVLYINLTFFCLLGTIAAYEKPETSYMLMFISTAISYFLLLFWFIEQCFICKISIQQIYRKSKSKISFISLILFQISNLFIFIPISRNITAVLASSSITSFSPLIINDVKNFFWYLNTLFLIPVTEELLYRFVFYNKIKNSIGLKWAIVFSSAVFAFFHFPNGYANVIYSFFLGFSYAIIYEYTGSIIITTLMHILNNSLANILYSIPNQILNNIFLLSDGKNSPGLTLVFTLSGIVFVILFLTKYTLKIIKKYKNSPFI